MTIDVIQAYVKTLRHKIKTLGINYLRNDERNSIALLEMQGIQVRERDQIIADLKPEDYVDGPIENKGSRLAPVVWVFGKEIKAYNICIKIYIGETNNRPVCVSFELVDEPMTYPFKIQ